MRVLVVHNRYRSSMPSGENRVVDDEVAMLRDAGIEVETFFRDSDDLEHLGPVRKGALAISPVYNATSVRHFRRVIQDRRPDVVHLHNPFPLVSPAVIRAAKRASIPVVQTVHNYRFACPSGLYFRDDRPCKDCLGKRFPWPAVQHGCYRDSRSQSLAMATSAWVHDPTWRMVDRFLCVSDFVADKLRETDIDPARVHVKHNAVTDPGPATPPGGGFVFAGRLSEEKGVELLLDSWLYAGLGASTTLTIAGDGPLRRHVEEAAATQLGINYVGPISRNEVWELVRAARAVVVPSTCYEALPTGVLEAFAMARPVVATDAGAAATLVDDAVGWCAPASTSSFADAMKASATDDVVGRGLEARSRFVNHFSRDAVTRVALEHYAQLSSASLANSP